MIVRDLCPKFVRCADDESRPSRRPGRLAAVNSTRVRPAAATWLVLAVAFCRAPVTHGAPPVDDATTFGAALIAGDRALADGKLDEAHTQVVRALERDAKSPKAWDLRARWAA